LSLSDDEKAEFRAIGKLYGLENEAEAAIEQGASLKAFKKAVLDRLNKKNDFFHCNEPDIGPDIGLEGLRPKF
jgi:hypothetical protein